MSGIRAVTIRLIACGLLITGSVSVSNGETISLDELLEQLDLSVISDLTGVEQKKLENITRQLQNRLGNQYVITVSPLRNLAQSVCEWIQDDDRFEPYANWLRDWIEATRELQDERPIISAPPLTLALPVRPDVPPMPSALRLAPEYPIAVSIPPTAFPRVIPARAREHVPRLKPIFVEEGVPGELVWLAEVESAFNPRARSRAGAAGLFQFMPETAFLMGLRTRPVDERMDPEKSARASARYLRYLYSKFYDWPLVMAAYNGGEGRVRRLLQESGGRRLEHIASRLPEETRSYVPKIEATLQLREGVSLTELPSPR